MPSILKKDMSDSVKFCLDCKHCKIYSEFNEQLHRDEPWVRCRNSKFLEIDLITGNKSRPSLSISQVRENICQGQHFEECEDANQSARCAVTLYLKEQDIFKEKRFLAWHKKLDDEKAAKLKHIEEVKKLSFWKRWLKYLKIGKD